MLILILKKVIYILIFLLNHILLIYFKNKDFK